MTSVPSLLDMFSRALPDGPDSSRKPMTVRLFGKLAGPLRGTKWSARHSGQRIDRVLLSTNPSRQGVKQNVCWQGRILGCLNLSRQTAHCRSLWTCSDASDISELDISDRFCFLFPKSVNYRNILFLTNSHCNGVFRSHGLLFTPTHCHCQLSAANLSQIIFTFVEWEATI